jgi:FkbM family methyltransferase
MTAEPAAPTVNTAVLNHFHGWEGTVPTGFFAYFLGNRSRADYWAFPEDIRRLYDRERFETFSGPALDDNIFDWLILLEAVVEARDEFTMVALGAGWGRWLVSAALAVKQFQPLPCRLIGVEAEPTHFQWMLEHFRDNDLDPADHHLIEAAASGRSGRAWFYCGKPASWYGQSIIHDRALDKLAGEAEVEYNNERARLVRTVDLAEVTEGRRKIDYLQMDVQGAEHEILAAAPQILDRKVKRVLVGTHSTEIEAELRDLFGSLNWRCQYDVPINGNVVVDGVAVTLGDGVQVWINPSI